MITRTELLSRARSALNFSTVYRLGGGETDPAAADPRDDKNSCDCSSFICWALGLHKFERGRAWLQTVNGGYFNTDGVWWDAVKTEMGLFDMIGWVANSATWTQARAGDLIVYPALWVARGAKLAALDLHLKEFKGSLPGVGHVALITDPVSVEGAGPMVIDCSSGNWSNHGDAIREHRWFPKHPAAVVARCVLVTD